MAHDVFISYSSRNKDDADLVCSYLERCGIGCWIAPRDIPSGTFLAPIVEAVRSSKALVLIFSSHANLSKYVLGELLQAFDHKVPIVPYRLEDVPYSNDLDLMLRPTQWVDGLDPNERHLEELRNKLDWLMKGSAGGVVHLPSLLDYDSTSILIMTAQRPAERGQIVSFLIEAVNGAGRRQDPTERYWAYIALGDIGGDVAMAAIRYGLANEDDEFARRGAADALRVALL